MGFAKREQERQDEEKWSQLSDTFVCSECLEDKGLISFIKNNSSRKGCSYCTDQTSKDRKSCNINVLLEYISDCVRQHYEDPAESMAFESREGGYQGSTFDTYDLLTSTIQTKSHKLLEAIISAFDHTLWCKIDPYSDSPSDKMLYDWQSFCGHIKHENRFFLNERSNRTLKRIVSDFQSHTKICTLYSGSTIYRARAFQSDQPFPLVLEEISMPKKEDIIKQSNRMSPAGIPLFYASDNLETCKMEAGLSNITNPPQDMIAYGSFRLNKNLKVFDLSALPTTPSIFEIHEQVHRETISFLRMFMENIMQPVVRDGREHVEYIPSQIFTEYIRQNMKLDKRAIDGICYPSAQNPNGKNYALFIKHDDITNSPTEEAILRLDSQIKIEEF